MYLRPFVGSGQPPLAVFWVGYIPTSCAGFFEGGEESMNRRVEIIAFSYILLTLVLFFLLRGIFQKVSNGTI